MFSKKYFSVVMVTFCMGASSIAAARSDLTIVNNTNQDSTSIINNGACSTILGKVGITRAHETNVVPAGLVAVACVTSPRACTAEVYMTNNCTGSPVARVVFDTKTGYISKEEINAAYKIDGNGFRIVMNGGR